MNLWKTGNSLEEILESLPGVGDVDVWCPICSGGLLDTGADQAVLISFNSFRGDAPAIKAILASGAGTVYGTNYVRGEFQDVIGLSTYSTVITNGISGPSNAYFVRVKAANSAGWSESSNSWPASIKPYIGHPMAPQNVDLVVASSTSLTISWDAPLSNGGSSISDYKMIAHTS